MKIAIVGSEPSTWKKVPELGPEWEIWRFSRRNFKLPPKPHRWFELHHPRNYQRYEDSCHGYIKFLEDIHAITFKTFPFQRLMDEFGPYFFTGGQAPWIMAYAITLNPQTIGLWGINPRGDYKPQLSEIQHFASLAISRGIEMIAPEDDVLELRGKLYALEKDYDHAAGARAVFLANNPDHDPRKRS